MMREEDTAALHVSYPYKRFFPTQLHNMKAVPFYFP